MINFIVPENISNLSSLHSEVLYWFYLTLRIQFKMKSSLLPTGIRKEFWSKGIMVAHTQISFHFHLSFFLNSLIYSLFCFGQELSPDAILRILEEFKLTQGNPFCPWVSILISLSFSNSPESMEDLRKVDTFGEFLGLKLFLNKKERPCWVLFILK